jgi:ABC-type multidrug transport system permease subunit
MVLNFRARFACFLLWALVIITELVFLKYLILDPIKEATQSFLNKLDYIATPILLLLHWVPVAILYFSSVQFVFSLWVGLFGWFYGIVDGVATVR